MDTWRERLGPPWYGVDAGLLHRLEIHETRVDALGPGRELVDLGDAVGVFDPVDPDPFFNRLAAIRWPADPDAFAARLDAATRLFVARDRQPYVWLAPGFLQPEDIADRLRVAGLHRPRGRAGDDPRARPAGRRTAAAPDGDGRACGSAGTPGMAAGRTPGWPPG